MNTRRLAQLAGVTRYEFLLVWRGKIMLVMLGMLLVMCVIFFGPMYDVLQHAQMLAGVEAFPPETKADMSRTFASMVWGPLCITLAGVLPILASDMIPKDRQYRVYPLLESMPLPTGVYLLGKLLGLWLSALSGLVVIMVSVGIIFWWLLDGFDPRPYLEIWGIGALSLLILNGGLAVLLPCGLSNRRAALILMAVVMGGALFLGGEGVWVYLNPIRAPIVMHYFTGFIPERPELISHFTGRDVFLSVGAGAAELVVFGALAWGWLRRGFERT
ncbi:MAG: hypothetical protein DWB42_11220 [Chloroflexi bacterium]|nr:hypothetical protein [Chloroflexota bacterium]MDL1883246.1 hypothetical protein [Anaerolineae bacterium CFX8]